MESHSKLFCHFASSLIPTVQVLQEQEEMAALDSWKDAPVDDSNAMRNFCGKLKFLKVKIRAWYADYRNNSKGTKVGEDMSRVHAWKEVIVKIKSRLSNWKLKTLSIGGRFTLLKSVLGSTPIFHMSIYKVPSSVTPFAGNPFRSHFFHGHEPKKEIEEEQNQDNSFPSESEKWCGKNFSTRPNSRPGCLAKQRLPLITAVDNSTVGTSGKTVPLKVNIMAWKIKMDGLPTRMNISRRGIEIDSIVCPICNSGAESS
ncbi:RNA-directed DNA polymerase, eukaryota [Tanacetum coccineum]